MIMFSVIVKVMKKFVVGYFQLEVDRELMYKIVFFFMRCFYFDYKGDWITGFGFKWRKGDEF